MNKIVSLICLICSLLLTKNAGAVDVRAHWQNRNEIRLLLPSGFYVGSNQFYLFTDSITSLGSTSAFLPLLSVDHGYVTLSTSGLTDQQIDDLIRRPLKVAIINNTNNAILDVTNIQYGGLLDEKYFYEESDLGSQCDLSRCSFKIWAPTAESVRLFVLEDPKSPTAMVYSGQRNEKGVWAFNTHASTLNKYYIYEVKVFQPRRDKIELSYVTDPYSKSLATNGRLSQVVDMESKELTPVGWGSLQKPRLNSVNDSVIYELVIRDFSATDASVPPDYKGTYLAFTLEGTEGIKHLRDMTEAGITHIHLLPFNDFGTVNENRSQWLDFNGKNVSDPHQPQSEIGSIRGQDPYNWGYDPVHYLTPEGSYATEPEGSTRIKEVREMISSLNKKGLRVIQDVVFNHTYQSGNEHYSIFDKIVPLYYYRLNEFGDTHTSSCCFDTATERRMMEKLMIDTLVFWAKNYKVDGFRFDLMNFHSKSTMVKARQAVQNLTLAKDGVDGSKFLFYGEGWRFGSFFNKYPNESMTSDNVFGTGIGAFNDRLRDAVRGGTTDSHGKSDQGFATGLFFDYNHEPANRETSGNLDEQRGRLLHFGDVIKVGLAGNLADYMFKEHLGTVIRGADLRFKGNVVGFAQNPVETINYVSAHDGYTLWDAVQAKAPFYSWGRNPGTASTEERRRMHLLAMAIPILGQGIPFLEGGTELLRSKSGDRDSFDSGDYFNRIDWTGNTNNWGVGLPAAWRNVDDWSFWEPRLKERQLHVTPAQISRTNEYIKALLRIRKSSSLFGLGDLQSISKKVSFIDNDFQQEVGLVAMYLHDSEEALLIFFNASLNNRIFTHHLLGQEWTLHPYLTETIDPALSQFSLNRSRNSIILPGRSTVILQLKK